MRPRPFGFPALALCATFAAAFGLSACAQRPILVGVPLGLTGLTSGIGVMARNGIELAAEEINAKGGIRGRSLELLVDDDGDDPNKALLADRRLLEAGAVALIGHMSSKSGSKAVAFANAFRIPLLSPTISSTDHSGKDDYFFRIIGANDLQGRTLAAWALAQGYTRAAIGWEATNRAYTEAVWQGFALSFTEGGGSVLAPLVFATARDERYGDLAAAILAQAPDVLLLACSSYDAASIRQELVKRGSGLPMLISMWARTDDLMSFGGRSVEGIVAVGGLDPLDPGSATQAFRAAFSERFGEAPDFGALYGYETLRILAAALTRSKRLDGPSIRQALVELGPLEGLQGPVGFDQFGDGIQPYRLYRVENGSFKALP